MKKGAKKWISFNFDSTPTAVSCDNSNTAGSLVKSTENTKLDCSSISSPSNVKRSKFNFLERLQPKSVEDLAVHSRKVKEVEAWIQQNVINSSNTPFAPILLLTGPTGAGKTATVQVLCRIVGIKLVEWINPTDQNYEMAFTQAQVEQFLDFFTQSKYASLTEAANSKKVVLVEDFPNFVTYNPTEFEGILEKCYCGSTPVIFVCTDANSSKLDLSRTLFPEETRSRFNITSINFNPCSASLLKGALKRAHSIAQAHLELFRPLSSDTIDVIVSSTMGDIRCAINQYHFAALKGTGKIPTVSISNQGRGAKRKRGEKALASVKSMSKDETLGFFHGLGRVLNPKRSEAGSSWRLQYDFDALVDQFGTQPSIFSAFLQENYLKYFGELDDVVKAADALSQAQVFLANWTDRHEVLLYALWVSVLGLMVFNEHKVSKWTQIKPPTKIKRVINNDVETRHLSRSDYLYYNIITGSDKFHVFKPQLNSS